MSAFIPLAPLFVNVGANIGPYQAQMAKVGATAKTTAATVGMASKLMIGAVLGIGIASLKMASDFQAGMANVGTLINGNKTRIAELGTSVKNLSISTGKSLDDLTGGLYQVISAFGDSAESVKLLEISAKAGTAGLATTTEALNLISATTKGYGDTSAEAAQKAADLAFETVRLGQTTFPELAGSIGRVVPVAAKMGVRVEELYAGFATLTGVTGDAAEVSTQMSGILRAMIKPTAGMVAAIEKTGYASAEAMIAELGLVGSMKKIIATSDGSTVAIGKLFRRAEALTALFALTGGQADVFISKLEALEGASGAATKAFEVQTDTLEHRMAVMLRKVQVAMTDLGESIIPVAEVIVGAFSNIANSMTGVAAAAGALMGLGFIKWLIGLDAAFIATSAHANALAGGLGAVSVAGAGANLAIKGLTVGLAAFIGVLIGYSLYDLLIRPLQDAAYLADMANKKLGELGKTVGKIATTGYEELRELSKKELAANITATNEAMFTQLQRIHALKEEVRKLSVAYGANSEQVRKAKENVEIAERKYGTLTALLKNLRLAYSDVGEAAAKTLTEKTLQVWTDWDEALERNKEAIEGIVPEVDKLYDRAVLLFASIKANNGNIAAFADQILELYNDFKKWNLELPKNISLIVEQAKAIQARNEGLKGAQALLDKELAYLKALDEEIEGIDWENYFKPLKEGAEDQIEQIDWEGALEAGRLDYKFALFGANAGDAFIGGFTTSLHNIGDLFKAVSIGIGDEISASLTRNLFGTETMLGRLSEDFGKTFAGKFLKAAIPVIGQFASQALNMVGSWIIGAFAGPSNEELLKRQGELAGRIFGDAFTSEVADIMAKVAEKLPRAASGKIDVLAAMWHPETVAAAIKNLTSVTTAELERWAHDIEDHVKPVLMTTLGFSETEAAQMIAPLFAELLSKALESEASIGPVFQRMISWVESLGIEIADVIGEAFKATRKELDDLLWSLRGAREQMAKLREERRSARQDTLSAQAQLRAQEDRLRYKREPGGPTMRGAEAYEAIQEAIAAATHGLTKAGKEKRYDIITEQERRDILAGVKGEQNKLLADQLIQAENIAKHTEHALERQKEQIQILRNNRTALRESRGKLELIKNRGGEIVDRLGPGGPIASGLRDVVLAIKAIPGEQHGGYIPKSGLAYLHAGETVIPAAAGLPNLRATINIGGMSFKDIIVKTIEDTAYARQSTIVSPAIQTRGA